MSAYHKQPEFAVEPPRCPWVLVLISFVVGYIVGTIVNLVFSIS